MPRNLTAQDRSALIRLARSLPAGSPQRKAILAGLVGGTRLAGDLGLSRGKASSENFFGDVRLWEGRRLPTEDELELAKTMDWQNWVAKPLPEDLYRYFMRTPGSIVVPLSSLTPIRAREKGLANANRYMWLSYWGEMARREPLSLKDNGDGSYTVLDGNSTYANANMSGWKYLIGIVEQP